MVGLQLALTTHKAILCPKLACDSPPPLNLQDDNNEIIAITTPVPDSTYASPPHRDRCVSFFFPFPRLPNFPFRIFIDEKETISHYICIHLLTNQNYFQLTNFATVYTHVEKDLFRSFSNLKIKKEQKKNEESSNIV